MSHPRSSAQPYISGLLGLIGAFATATANAAPVVTTLEGSGKAGDAALEMHAELPLDQPIETTDETRCSILLADTSLIQFCGHARLRVKKPSAEGPRVVQLDRGVMSATVGPQEFDPIEIHTPVAIASIVGTVIHVSVDPVTGASTISAVEGKVRVQSNDPALGGSIVISAGEQVTVEANQPPGQVSAMREGALAGDTACLFESDFRTLSLTRDRAIVDEAVVADIIEPDIMGPDQIQQLIGAPAVGSRPGSGGPGLGDGDLTDGGSAGSGPGGSGSSVIQPCFSLSCMMPQMPTMPMDPVVPPPMNCSPGLPGEQCLF